MEKLAIHGGTPVRNNFLAYGKQNINEEDIQSVINVLKGDYLTTGPNVNEFEDSVKQYVGVNYAVAISNGTAALHAACFAAGIKEGDEVIVSSITFAASANAVLYCGGTPVFADINPKTYNIDIEDIRNKISERTKAIIAVDFTGQSVDIDAIVALAKKHNLIVIEDGAHSLGSEYKGEKVGVKADMTTFSFHPVKPITTAEGGMVVTNNRDLYEKIMLFRSHGITRDPEIMKENDGPWYNEQQILGYNYRMTDLQCALGVSQMKRLDSFIQRRREIVNKYYDELSEIDSIILPYEEDFSNSGWHLFVIQIRPEKLSVSRKEIFEALIGENIGVNVHYLPVYLHYYYQKLGYQKGLCPKSEELYKNIITLPLHPSMTNSDVENVITALKKVLVYYEK